jgi:hypothetical protein
VAGCFLRRALCLRRACIRAWVRYVRAFTLQEILKSNNTISIMNINNNNLDPRLIWKRKDLLCNVLWLSDPHMRGVGEVSVSLNLTASVCELSGATTQASARPFVSLTSFFFFFFLPSLPSPPPTIHPCGVNFDVALRGWGGNEKVAGSEMRQGLQDAESV